MYEKIKKIPQKNIVTKFFCRSQLYKELKEARDKVAQLEQQLLLTGANNSCQDKENSAPAPRSKLMKRLVGRGGQGAKAAACLV